MRFTYFAMYILSQLKKPQNKTLGDLGFEWAEEAGGYAGSKVTVMRKHEVCLGKGEVSHMDGQMESTGVGGERQPGPACQESMYKTLAQGLDRL